MKKFLFAVAFLLSGTVNASSNFGVQSVGKIVLHDSGNILVTFVSDQVVHTESCGSQKTYVLQKTNVFLKEMYSGLLAALYSDTKISGYVDGCTTIWSQTYPTITRIDFLGHDAQ